MKTSKITNKKEKYKNKPIKEINVSMVQKNKNKNRSSSYKEERLLNITKNINKRMKSGYKKYLMNPVEGRSSEFPKKSNTSSSKNKFNSNSIEKVDFPLL